MTFPNIVQASSFQHDDSNRVSYFVPRPSGLTVGNMLLMIVGVDGGFRTIDMTASGFTHIGSSISSGGTTLRIGWRRVNGLEPSEFIVGISSGETINVIIYEIEDSADPNISPPTLSSASGTSTTPDPPSHTPVGGADDILWIGTFVQNVTSTSRTLDSFPANMTDAAPAEQSEIGTTTISSALGADAEESNATSFNPDVFTMNESDDWSAATISIYPPVLDANITPVIESSTLNDQHPDVGGPGNQTTLDFNMPNPAPDGRLYVAFGMKDDDPAWGGIPGNWTQIFQATQGTNQNLGAWWWIGDNEPTSYTLTQDNEVGVAIVIEISGFDLSNPIHNQADLGNVPPDEIADHSALKSGTTSPATCQIQTPTISNTLILTCCAMDTDDITVAAGNGFFEIFKGGDGGAGDVGYGAQFKPGPEAGVATTVSTYSTSGPDDEWSTAIMFITPKVIKPNEPIVNLFDSALGDVNSYAGPYVI